jgi:hypothetical protein
MHKKSCLTIVALLAGALAMAGAGPPTAQQVLANAKAQAGAQHRNIFVLFEASW